jgi:hypothetical protein
MAKAKAVAISSLSLSLSKIPRTDMLARFLDDIIKLNLGGKPDSNRNNEDTESAEEAQRTVSFCGDHLLTDSSVSVKYFISS